MKQRNEKKEMTDIFHMNQRYDEKKIFQNVKDLLLADVELELMNLNMQEIKLGTNHPDMKKLSKLIAFHQNKSLEIEQAKELADLHLTLDSAVFHVLTPYDVQKKLLEQKCVAYDAQFNPVFLSEEVKARILRPYRIQSREQYHQPVKKQNLLSKLKNIFTKQNVKRKMNESNREL